MGQPAEQPSPRARKRWAFQPGRSIGHRFIAYLTVLSILPLLLLGLASFEISRSALQAEAESHLLQLLVERKRYVDLQTEQIEDLIANISGVEAITTGLSTPFDPADAYARLSMQARIGYILNGYVNIKGLVSIDIFSAQGAHYHVGDTLDVGALRRDVLEELRRAAAASARPVHWAGIVDNVNGNSKQPKVITAAKVIYGFQPATLQQTPLGLLLVNYNPDYLREQFGEFAGGGAVQVTLVDGDGRLLVHPNRQRIGTPIGSALQQRLQGDSGSFRWDVNGGSPTLVSFRRSEPTGWPVVGFVSLSVINAHAAAIGQATAVVVLLCLAMAGIAAVSYSRRVVAPLRQITDRFNQMRNEPALIQDHLPVRGEDDVAELTRCFNAFLDGIHEQERAEQALKQADAERRARLAAEAASEAKSLFLAKMSHDLRTPLNAVLGYAQLLKLDKTLTERQLRGLNAIHSSGDHLLTLINDILDLSKIEAGKMDLHPQDVDLAALLQNIVDTIRVRAEGKGLDFAFVASPELPQALRLDDKRLRQVLLNLLDNAVKFTDHGQVALKVQALPPEPGATAAVDTARLRFEVEDNGVGIAPDKIEASFQPFEQVGDVRRRSGGTGLGLSISRQLIRVMGSDIRVRSAVGEGTCFWFDLVLPLGAASLPAPPVARTVVGYGGPVKRVLVVDDVAENRALIGSFLLPLGFEIAEAENGQQALEQALSSRPDLVLMDMFMPMMDGTQAIRNMRSEPALASVPIISVSAIAASSDRARSLAAGANAFLPKPIDFDALTAEIGQLLGLSWVFDEAAADALTRRC